MAKVIPGGLGMWISSWTTCRIPGGHEPSQATHWHVPHKSVALKGQWHLRTETHCLKVAKSRHGFSHLDNGYEISFALLPQQNPHKAKTEESKERVTCEKVSSVE